MTENVAFDLVTSSTLCTNCGLCCEGALHRFAVLRPEEVSRAKALGLPVIDGAATPSFALPCPKLADRRCTIYAERPRVCAGYKCQLLLSLESDFLSLNAALTIVAKARGMYDEFVSDTLAPTPTSPEETGRQTLRRTVLRLYLDQHFLNANDGKMVKQQVVGPSI